MGLTDRALRAASALLEHARALDPAAGADPDPSGPVAGADPGAEDPAARARRLGAPDPALLLTAEEAADVLGSPVGPPRLTGGDDTTGRAFRAGAPGARGGADGPREVGVVAFHAPTDDALPFDPAEHWYGFVEGIVADDGIPVAGLGRAAVRTDGGLYVLGATALLHLSGGPAGTGDGLVDLARRVLARLDGPRGA
jgi:hypothetical protein